jgi:hypothetical protein
MRNGQDARLLDGLVAFREYLLNSVVNKIPFVAVRSFAYQVACVSFSARRTGMIMMHAEVNAPGRLRIGAHSVNGTRSWTREVE